MNPHQRLPIKDSSSFLEQKYFTLIALYWLIQGIDSSLIYISITKLSKTNLQTDLTTCTINTIIPTYYSGKIETSKQSKLTTN